jgi:NAD(P)-dependent dehydrogenase (short-subunit alcohol dehydrogenase family)
MELNNRVAVITGAAGGLGRIVTRQMAENGAMLALAGKNVEKLEELKRELKLSPDRLLTLAVDLGQPGSAEKVKNAALEKYSRVDILLHFVGGWIGGKPVTQVDMEEVETMLQQHLWTTLYLAQAFVPLLVSNGWGRIIVVSHPNVSTPPANVAPYVIGKSAQEALMLTLAAELKDTGVTANILRVRSIDVNHERDREKTPKNSSWTTPEEISAAILYLCSDEARAVNGARIPLHLS